MKINLFILQLAIVFLPGLIWAGVDASYARKSAPSDMAFLFRTFLFGLISYAVTFVLFSLAGWQFTLVDLSLAETDTLAPRASAYEVISAIVVSLALSIIWIFASTYKWVTRFLQWINATKTYGDEDVWDFTFNSRNAAVEYVHFRDFANKIVYAGWVNTFSETGKLRELVLRDVQIFDFDGKMLFEMPLVYLARPPESIHVEFPYRP